MTEQFRTAEQFQKAERPPTAEPPAERGADVPLLQLVTAGGERVTDASHPDHGDAVARAAALDAEQLRTMLSDMVLVRRFDTEATALQRQGELGLWAQSLGQEAAQIGSGRALRSQDFAFPSYREHGVAHTRGMDLVRILGLFRGVEHGGWDPAELNFHLYTLVIGSHTLHAAGYAMGVQRDGMVGTGEPERDTAVIVYFGDGATSQGDTNEAMVFAAVGNAPLVFFCQNNQWAISEPSSRQSRVPLFRRGDGFGIPSLRVDGNDVLACYAATQAALDRARSGGGPTLVEAYTYRMGAHTTSDDPSRYRSAAEEEHWRSRDPIDRFRTLLLAEQVIDAAWLAELDARADALGERVRTECRAMAAPAAVTMFDHVYAAPHALVDAERARFEDFEASFEGTR